MSKDILKRVNYIAASRNDKSDLTVATVAAHDRDSGLLHYMILSVFKFSDVLPQIIVCDNGHNGPLKKMYENNKYVTIVNRAEQHPNASVEHGIGLNTVMERISGQQHHRHYTPALICLLIKVPNSTICLNSAGVALNTWSRIVVSDLSKVKCFSIISAPRLMAISAVSIPIVWSL